MSGAFVDQIGLDSWLLRNSQQPAQRWVMLCYPVGDDGFAVASRLVESAGDESWWVVTVAIAGVSHDETVAADLAPNTVINRALDHLERVTGSAPGRFYLLAVGAAIGAALHYTGFYPERIARLALLPLCEQTLGLDQNRENGEKNAVRYFADTDARQLGYGVLRTPIRVALPANVLEVGGSAELSRARLSGLRQDLGLWLNQLKRVAGRRGVLLDCCVLEWGQRDPFVQSLPLSCSKRYATMGVSMAAMISDDPLCGQLLSQPATNQPTSFKFFL